MACILIVGHCGFDGPRLRRLCESIKNVDKVEALNSGDELRSYLKEGKSADLVLINRVFAMSDDEGLPLIEELADQYPSVKFMLVSNYAESQKQAEEKGAITGFGKDHLDDPGTKKRIEEAIAK